MIHPRLSINGLSSINWSVLDAGYEGLFDLEVLGPAIEAEGYAPALRRGVGRASVLLAHAGL